jgi:hypothetical protein
VVVTARRHRDGAGPAGQRAGRVVSEAMRDLDLIVTTVANDPLWLEHYRGWPAIDKYWEPHRQQLP